MTGWGVITALIVYVTIGVLVDQLSEEHMADRGEEESAFLIRIVFAATWLPCLLIVAVALALGWKGPK